VKLPTYLNLDLAAPGVRVLLDSVVVDGEGTLSLAQVHGGAGQPLADDATLGLSGAASIGVTADGDVYVADTAANRVLRVPACGGDGEPVGCLSQMLKAPRGVLVGPRDSLYVADSGNARIVVVDLVTGQLRGIWQDFGEPWDLAADANNRLYVVEHGPRRIVRIDLDGRLDPSFSLAHASTSPRRPESVLTTVHAGEEMLVVFDRVSANRLRVLVYHLDGVFAEHETRRLREVLADTAAELLGPATVGGELIYIAEAATGRILSFDLAGHFVGSARWQGQVSALALDEQGRLVVGGAGLVALEAGHSAASGTFRVGPIAAPLAPPEGSHWQLVRALVDTPLPADAHFQLFVWTTANEGDTPPDLDDPSWIAAPLDAPAWRPAVDPSAFIWIGGGLTSGAAGGPVIRGLRLDFDREGWLRHLPAIYARESAAFLEPALAALEDALREQDGVIDCLPRLFDPAATPAADLEWLAGWLAFELEESFDEPTRRQVIAKAFELQGLRGTAQSLRGAIQLVFGIDAQIREPAAYLSVWQLGDYARGLGFDTTLFAGEPDGAVVGVTAELGQSSLEADEDFGAPVFDASAHRFCVRVYGSDLEGPDTRAALKRLVERQRPAETEAHVCVIEPAARVGFQATVGLDAVVGREGEPLRLGETGLLGAGASLRNEPARLTAGDATRLGPGITLI
jgi:phage tail-like protein